MRTAPLSPAWRTSRGRRARRPLWRRRAPGTRSGGPRRSRGSWSGRGGRRWSPRRRSARARPALGGLGVMSVTCGRWKMEGKGAMQRCVTNERGARREAVSGRILVDPDECLQFLCSVVGGGGGATCCGAAEATPARRAFSGRPASAGCRGPAPAPDVRGRRRSRGRQPRASRRRRLRASGPGRTTAPRRAARARAAGPRRPLRAPIRLRELGRSLL